MKSSPYIVVSVLSLAFALRIAFIAAPVRELSSDEIEYFQLARSIIVEHSYSINSVPTAYRAPAYPAFIAVLLAAIPSVTFVLIIQALLETITGLLLYRIGSALMDQRAGLTAMSIWAFLPSSILMPGLLLSESLFTTVLTGIVYLCCVAPRRSLLLGLLFGISIMIKPQMAAVTAAWSVWTLLQRNWKRSIIVIGVAAVVATPWIIRNSMVIGEPAVSTNGGVNFWIGNNPDANGSYKIPKHDPLSSIADELERSKEGYRLGAEFIADHPVDAAVLAGRKAAYLWSSQQYLYMMKYRGIDRNIPYREQVHHIPAVAVIIMNLPYVLMILFGIIGFFVLPESSTGIRRSMLLLILVWMILHMIYFGMARFNYPLLPLFAIASSAGYHYRQQVRSLALHQRLLAVFLCGMFLLVLIAEFLITYL